MTVKAGDKVRFYTASTISDEICTIMKTRNYKTKGLRMYLKSEYGYCFAKWSSDMNYEKV